MNKSLAINSDSYFQLILTLKQSIKNPVNSWAVYATLESIGLRDIDAQNDYGFESLHKLANYIYEDFVNSDSLKQRSYSQRFSGESFFDQIRRFIRYYSLGLFTAFSLVINVATILMYDYGLWAWLKFNPLQATIVANGTILSFITTGGLTQVVGHQLSYYKDNDIFLGYRVINSLLIVVFYIIFFVALFIFILNVIIPFYSIEMMSISLVYFILLSFFLITSSILNSLEQRIPMGISFVTGILFVFLGMEILDIGIYLSHFLGILVAIFTNVIYSYAYFKIRLTKLNYKKTLSKKLGLEVIFFRSYKYFIYGTILSIFLFLDRIIAWSSGSPPIKVIWFNSTFELGMDWALLPLLLTLGVLEYTIQTFSKYILQAQKRTSLNLLMHFKRFFYKFYIRRLLLLIFLGIISIFGSYYFLLIFKPYAHSMPKIDVFFSNPVITKIFWFASIGYLFTAIGLFNSLFFFTLNQPNWAMHAIIYATLFNVCIGLVFSRIISFEYSIVGLVVGGMVFAIMTSIKAYKFFKNLDYYYYMAL